MREEGYEHYSMVIEWSEEDQAYIVTAPELPGCRTHGATYELAVEQGQDAIVSWISARRATQRPVQAPRTRRKRSGGSTKLARMAAESLLKGPFCHLRPGRVRLSAGWMPPDKHPAPPRAAEHRPVKLQRLDGCSTARRDPEQHRPVITPA